MAITEKQAADRKKGIGSSDVACIFGMNPYRTALDLWLEKTGRVDSFTGNEATMWGDFMEPGILKYVEHALGEKVYAPKQTFVKGILRSNVDGMVGKFAKGQPIVEAKSSLVDAGWGEPGTDQIPDMVMLQVQHQLICAESDDAIVCRLSHRKFDIYCVGIDIDLCHAIQTRCEKWWIEHIVADVAPEASGMTDSTKEYFASMKRENDTVAEIDPEMAKRHIEITAIIKDLKDEQSTIKSLLMQQVGEASRGQGGGYMMNVTVVKGKQTVDSKLLKMRHPDVYEQVLKTNNPHTRAIPKKMKEAE
ncbi:MAG: YqaJ viral recombinase family protein [Pseudomonadales bacterium]|nr:YqaJ viral recombinase family protein [Pseudomonadales bacterium]